MLLWSRYLAIPSEASLLSLTSNTEELSFRVGQLSAALEPVFRVVDIGSCGVVHVEHPAFITSNNILEKLLSVRAKKQ